MPRIAACLRYLPLPALLLLPACFAVVQDESSPFYMAPPGSVVVLHQDLEVPPGTASVYIQRGRVTSRAAYNRYYPHCRFEVRDVSEQPQIIHAGQFRVEKATRETDFFAGTGITHYARLGMGQGSDGASLEMEVVKMRLHSAAQPEVLRFVCGGVMDFPFYVKPPSIQEIRGTLGGLVSLELP